MRAPVLLLLVASLTAGVVARADRVAEPDPLAPLPLAGPFPSLDELCKAYQAERGPGACMWDAKDVPTLALSAANPPAPFRAARFGVHGDTPVDETSEGDCVVAVQTERGWYMTVSRDLDMFCLDKWQKARVAELAFAGTPPRLLVRWTTLIGDRVRPREGGRKPGIYTRCVSQVRVCGIGASGAPSCTPVLTVAGVADCQGADLFTPPAVKVRWDWSVDVSIDKQGRLVMGGSKAAVKKLDPDTARAVGTHEIVFP